MSLAALLVVAVLVLALGLTLWRTSRRGGAPPQAKTVGIVLVSVGALGILAIVADLVMFALFP